MLYCAKFYGGGFGRVYEPKTPVIKLCTVQHYSIIDCRKSILFNDGRAWTKKEKNFDVTMGAQDGAEIAELTGIYLLQQVNDSLSKMKKKTHTGLYRDDGLIYIEDASGPLISGIEKTLHRIFKSNKLSISLEQKGHVVNFLDVTMDTDRTHKPYKKPNSKITYVSKASNHPPSITKRFCGQSAVKDPAGTASLPITYAKSALRSRRSGGSRRM